MEKIKFTKGELKKQRDALKQYQRYLPTLQLKKQQLQIEILRQRILLDKTKGEFLKKQEIAKGWAGLLSQEQIDLKLWIHPEEVMSGTRNIAGVNVPVYKQVKFKPAEYDLFLMPLWVDGVIDELRGLVSLREHLNLLEEEIAILKQELRITTQRVNLFEKVKIPEAGEAIRRIKIYIGDQTANAVGRSKIAKRKIETLVLEGAIG